MEISSNVPATRAIRVLLIAPILASLAIAAQTSSLSLSSGSGSPGSIVTLGLSLTAAGGQPESLQWTITYPTRDFSGLTVSAGAAASSAGKSITCNSAAGISSCVAWGLNSNMIPNGLVASITLTVSALPADSAAVIQVSGGDSASLAGSSVATSTVSGSVTIQQSTTTATVSAVSCTPLAVIPPAKPTCTVTITPTAPTGGTTVGLSSDSLQATVPASVIVPAGGTTASFSVTTAAVSFNTTAHIGATIGSSSLAFPLMLEMTGPSGSTPVTFTFTGTGSGALGGTQFSNSAFTMTLTSDTRLARVPACCASEISTPSGIPATFSVNGVTATLADTQAVFVSQASNEVGVWHQGASNWLTLTNAAFAGYNLQPNISDSGTGSILGNFFNTPAGMLSMTSVSNVSFTAHVGPAVIWTSDASREAVRWYFTGSGGNTEAAWEWLSQGGVYGWHVAAMIDFNGDGYSDIIWVNDATRQAVVWYMGGPDGNVEQSWEWLSQTGVPGWSLVGAADFNNDGIPDLLWENDATHQVVVWYMSGTGTNGAHTWAWLSQAGVWGWTIKAVGDYNHDGTPDIVWQNDSTRESVVWYLSQQGTNELGWEWISQSGVPGWSIAGFGDFNGDGILDVLLVNDATRQAVVWYLEGQGTQGNHTWGWLSQTGVFGWTPVVAH